MGSRNMVNSIQRVGALYLEKPFWHEGVRFIAKKFPTRRTVCGTNPEPASGEPSDIKVSISKISLSPPLSESEKAYIQKTLIDRMQDPAIAKRDVLLWAREYVSFLCYRPDIVLKAAAKVNGVSITKIKSKSRKREIVDARFMFFYYMTIKGSGLEYVGKYVKKSHCTVLHGRDKVAEFLDIGDKEFCAQYEKFTELVKEELEKL